MIQSTRIITCGAFIALFTACSQPQQTSTLQEAWDAENAPELMDIKVTKLEGLPSEGSLPEDKFAWSDDYWATYSGGISRRWQYELESDNYKDHIYEFTTRERILDGLVDIEKLSPAEKYDLLNGRYDFPLAKHERENMLSSVDPKTDSIPRWFGLCHGWAPATIMEPEAGRVAIMKNPDGIEIPFYTSDIKGLMTKIYAEFNNSYSGVGDRCNLESHEIERDANGRIIQKECRDLNPGTFHLTLTQMLGHSDVEARKGFVADVTYSAQVWNQAVVAYRVKKQDVVKYESAGDSVAEFRAPGTAFLATVRVEMDYITEIGPHTQPMMEHKDSYVLTDELEYTLELDADGVIIGGEWLSEKHPDFLWLMKEKPNTGNSYISYDLVRELLDKSRESAE